MGVGTLREGGRYSEGEGYCKRKVVGTLQEGGGTLREGVGTLRGGGRYSEGWSKVL